jgi:hypothetical protein
MQSSKVAIHSKTWGATRTCFACAVIVIMTAGFPVEGGAAPSTINLSLSWDIPSFQTFALQFTNAVAADAESDTLVVLQANGQVTDTEGFAPLDVPPGLSNVIALSCGFAVNMALRSDGTAIAWGDNEFGQNNMPNGLSNVVAIAAGWWHALALLSNGAVASWGEITNVPGGLSNVVAIAAGQQRSLALQANGTVVEWGPDASSVPSGLSNVIAIASDSGGDLALMADGTALAWDNMFTKSLPGITNAVAISGDSETFLALLADGSVVSGGEDALSFSQPVSNAFFISVGQFVEFGTVITGDGSPVFTVQPGAQAAGAGGTIWLRARAVGSQPITYQWQLNGTNLPGATNGDLIITNATAANGGQYQALATNSLNWAASSTAMVAVLPPPIRIAALLNAPMPQPDGSVLITASAPNGAAFPLSDSALFIFEASSDLSQWNPLTNAFTLTNGAIDFRDPLAGTTPARFYRLLRQ